ncbi:uncharacterized protein AMSG_09937 [Thecamonas trahens ATCC 50062]|uniref:Uncharacterized protein n=1 Tax=Thecamonas trahens ATCC 50062 TaxID=461836 RepID=A0A0L0DPD3_THETB|nr:hypothetical protein AMSG_09937 [Thecamonas trahens ATCC 50062]KNC54157.1 hypothetical protein AMSG_09937 [Thecamonas trahens ATCC 50062]|eukprot:XP_013753978.1 hypothetical protein AMSG_09937 [Thecamonas trahens ATCC 50062]
MASAMLIAFCIVNITTAKSRSAKTVYPPEAAEYNQMVDEWVASKHAEFNAIKVYANNGGPSSGPHGTLFNATVATGDADFRHARSYPKIMYFSSGTSTSRYTASGSQSPTTWKKTARLTIELPDGDVQSVSFDFTIAKYERVTSTRYSLSRRCNWPDFVANNSPEYDACSKVCAEDGGSWSGNTCTVTGVLSGFCIKLVQTSNPSSPVWSVSKSGCLPKRQLNYAADTGIEAYRPTPLSSPIDMARINITVRSDADPYLYLASATLDTKTGASSLDIAGDYVPGEQPSRVYIYATVGIVLANVCYVVLALVAHKAYTRREQKAAGAKAEAEPAAVPMGATASPASAKKLETMAMSQPPQAVYGAPPPGMPALGVAMRTRLTLS